MRKSKSVVRKVISLVLGLVMVMGLAVPVMANNNEREIIPSITIMLPEFPGVAFTLENVYSDYFFRTQDNTTMIEMEWYGEHDQYTRPREEGSDLPYFRMHQAAGSTFSRYVFEFPRSGGSITINRNIDFERMGNQINNGAWGGFRGGVITVNNGVTMSIGGFEEGFTGIRNDSLSGRLIDDGTFVPSRIHENDVVYIASLSFFSHSAEYGQMTESTLMESRSIWELAVNGGGTTTQPPVTTPTDPTTAPNLSTASNWAHDGINQAFRLGLIPQSLQNNYRNNTTRAEFSALAVALYETVTGREITGRMQFNDTNDINVQKMGYLGVVSGVGSGNFAPNNTLTREQAAVMLARLADVIGQPLPASAPTFADNSQISSWAFDAVGQIQAVGIMGGVGNNQFAPQSDYTREQSIITILRLFEILNVPAEFDLVVTLTQRLDIGISALASTQPLNYSRDVNTTATTYTLRVGTILAFQHWHTENPNTYVAGLRSYLATNPQHFPVVGSNIGRWEFGNQRHLFDYVVSEGQFSNFAGNQGVTVDGDTAWIVLDTPGLFAWFTDAIFVNSDGMTDGSMVGFLINVVE